MLQGEEAVRPREINNGSTPVGELKPEVVTNQDNQSINSTEHNSSDNQLPDQIDMESSSISQFSGEVDFRSQQERDWKSEYKLKLFRRDVRKRVNRFFEKVKAILDKNDVDVKVRLSNI